MNLWSWVAYALFSRHAQHNIEEVYVHDRFVSTWASDAFQKILRAKNPLAMILGTSTPEGQWLTASQYSIESPHDALPGEIAILKTQEPLTVRVIAKQTVGGSVWWKVLLPGCGAAFVRQEDATVPFTETDASEPNAPLYNRFQRLSPSNVNATMRFLQLLAHRVRGVVVEAFEVPEHLDGSDGYTDMTRWSPQVVRGCPNIERFHLPSYTRMDDLHFLIERCASGNLRLRELDLECKLNTDTSDLIEFLDVLCDMTHPLTRHLEKLRFHAVIPANPTRDFRAAWERLLHENRLLRTISPIVSPHDAFEGSDAGTVVLRTSPLSLAAKLAFLSVVEDSSRLGTVARLDPSVIGPRFAFAAPSLAREIMIESCEC